MKRGQWPVAGLDEAGRGPLAGPVVAAAVILDPKRIPKGLDDSKRLTADAREGLFDAILKKALAVSLYREPSSPVVSGVVIWTASRYRARWAR